MKQFFFILAVLIALPLGCKKNEKPEPGTSSAQQRAADAPPAKLTSTEPPFAGGRKTSFQEVTSQLDPGGSLFLYLATDQWLAGLSTNVAQLREIAMAVPGPVADNRDEVGHLFDLATRLIASSGVEDVTGVGVSAAPVAPGLFRNKLILHHSSGAGQGFAWTLFGRQPHPLSVQDMLPENTALAMGGDLDVAQLWRVLEQELKQSGIRNAAQTAASLPQAFEKQTGIPFLPLLASLGGELGVILTLDNTKIVTMPVGREPMDIPTPALVVFLKVNNELLYERLSAKFQENPKTVLSQADGLKLCAMPLDQPPPFPLEPTLGSSGDYFYFATSPEAVRAVQSVRRGKSPGLKKSPEFQSLAQHLPAQGNQFVYVSRALGDTVRDLQMRAMKDSPLPPEQVATLQRLLGTGGPSYSLSVGAHTATGWQTVSVGNQDSGGAAMLVPTVGVTAIAAAVMLPALAKAKGRAQTVSSVNQMKQLGLAARIYANDNKDKYPNAATWSDDIRDAVANPKVFKAPNDPSPGPCSYAYNARLSGMNEGSINPQTVLFFEVEGGPMNRSGGPELMLRQPRSGGLFVVGFADGSVQQLPPAQVRSLRWDP